MSLPLGLANLLSSSAFQYSGELHYSAPLAADFVVAGVIGLTRLLGLIRLWQRGPPEGHPSRRGLSRSGKLVTALGVALNPDPRALAYQAWAGYTPIGQEYWRRVAGGWPAVSAHDRLLARFAAQIPPAAALSTSPGPVASSQSSGRGSTSFRSCPQPNGARSTCQATRTGIRPLEIQSALQALLAGGWGVADAADGYVLLQKGRGAATLPDAFYDFAQRRVRRAAAPARRYFWLGRFN